MAQLPNLVNTPCSGNHNGLGPKEDLPILSIKHLMKQRFPDAFLQHFPLFTTQEVRCDANER